MFFILLEAFILASSLSFDAFAAGLAYGGSRIRIPFISTQIISFICSGVLGISLLAGIIVRPFLADWLTAAVSFAILLVLGIMKLLDGATKAFILRHNSLHREFKFSMFNFKFILHLYADPEKADIDGSRDISPAEAVSLALALSLDGLAVGFGASLGEIHIPAVIVCSLAANTAAVIAGSRLGGRLAKKIPLNLTWISGAILIGLAVAKLF